MGQNVNAHETVAAKETVQEIVNRHGYRATIEPVTGFTNPALQALFDIWSRKCTGRIMPRRSDIALRDIYAYSSHIAVVDVVSDALGRKRYALRLVGDDFSRTTGHFASEYVDEYEDETYKAVTTAVLDAVCMQRASIRYAGTVPKCGLEHVHSETFFAPLSNDGIDVNQILIATWFSSALSAA